MEDLSMPSDEKAHQPASLDVWQSSAAIKACVWTHVCIYPLHDTLNADDYCSVWNDLVFRFFKILYPYFLSHAALSLWWRSLKSSDWLVPCESRALFLGDWRMRGIKEKACWGWPLGLHVVGASSLPGHSCKVCHRSSRAKGRNVRKVCGRKVEHWACRRPAFSLHKPVFFGLSCLFDSLWPLTWRIRGRISLLPQWETTMVQKA